ncbi:MAG TPA: MFS transporter [Bryobacteraceae bacterium]|jgi:ACS family hexuronate transporter-like MFS transporter
MPPGPVRPSASHYRWYICALLFFSTVIAYIDRGVLGYLKDTLQHVIGWNAIQYSHVLTSFQIAYAIGLVGAGWFTDRLGTRKGLAIAIVLWSFAAMSPGAASSVLTFGIAMFFLGIGEAANFPACIKTVAEWFPKGERALATGIFNSGANIGTLAVPLLVPLLVGAFTWRGAFAVAGSTGFIWLAFWLLMYARPEHHRSVSAAELAYIQSDPGERLEEVAWLRLLPCKETWVFAIAKFLSDPIWWFYIFWLPGYLQETFHLDLSANRWPVAVAFGLASIGSVGGGWLSGAMLKGGRSLNVARKSALLVCALAVLPVLYAPFAKNVWVVVGLTGLAMAAHQGWSANLFTVVSDLFPKAAVASVVGIGGMVGALGGALFQTFTGYVVEWTHSYIPVFAVCGSSYFVALVIVHLMTPRYTPAKLN